MAAKKEYTVVVEGVDVLGPSGAELPDRDGRPLHPECRWVLFPWDVAEAEGWLGTIWGVSSSEARKAVRENLGILMKRCGLGSLAHRGAGTRLPR